MPQQQSLGGFRLFKAFGVTVYVHWTWFIVAVLGVQWGRSLFGSIEWAAAAYLVLLIFNLLPIYPLDGGQIVRALLWFVIGRANSLAVAAWMGIVVAGLGCVAALATANWWLALIAAFAVLQSWVGISRARRLREAGNAPRYMGVACPSCGAAPPAGPFWRCECGQAFDPFQTGALCPACGRAHALTACPECDRRSPLARWHAATPLPLPPIAPAAPVQDPWPQVP